MRIHLGPEHPPPSRRRVVTIGVFDGVHVAHQRVLGVTVRLARRLRAESLAVTFDPDPESVLRPSHAQPTLMPLGARLDWLSRLGVDRAWVIPFTARFARTRADLFVRRVLQARLGAVAVVVGEAFVFGRQRRGDMALLRRLGAAHGLGVVEVPAVRRGGAAVSSSRIRQLIARGRLADARRLLGRPATLYGCVVPGAGRGRRLRVPTANLRLQSAVLPPRGVYAVLVKDEGPSGRRPERAKRVVAQLPAVARHDPERAQGASRGIEGRSFGARGTTPLRGRWRGVMNLGVRPTFGAGPLTCEVHLLDFSGSLRRRQLSVALLARLRQERRFPTPAALTRQIRRDITRTKRLVPRRSARR